ncbi:MAG: hypothetical protein MUP11_00270, partial [Anaerolineales bacterium]|nr:hypothetical protein [Anaerolineales bacterium]
MDLTIVGMAISYQHCPSLQSLKQLLFTGSPVKEGARLDPVEVVIQAVNDVSPHHQDEIGIISPDGFNISSCKSNLAGYFDQVIEIGSFSGSINDSLQDADRWLQGSKSRLVLITQDTKLGTSCIVLSAKNTSLPAYALLRSAEAENDLFGTGLVVFNQEFQTIPQANINELVKLSNFVSGESQIAQTVNPSRFFEGSGINNLIFTALAVSEKVIPQAIYTSETDHSFLVNRDYYTPTHPRPWLSQGNDFQRSALFVETLADSQPGDALIIQEPPLSKPQPAFQRISPSDPYLFPIGGNNQEGLQSNLASFKQKLESSTPLSDLAILAYTQENTKGSAYICSIVGADRESLLNEITHAKTGIDNAFANLKSWTSPGGSYFTPAPLGASGVAFVYPGAFNSYPNMARDLFTSFPKLHELTKEIIPNLSHSLAEEFLYPRSFSPSPEDHPEELINDIYNHPNELVESGISLSVLHTL